MKLLEFIQKSFYLCINFGLNYKEIKVNYAYNSAISKEGEINFV